MSKLIRNSLPTIKMEQVKLNINLQTIPLKLDGGYALPPLVITRTLCQYPKMVVLQLAGKLQRILVFLLFLGYKFIIN